MELHPNMSLKSIHDVEPGELVRLSTHGTSVLALMASQEVGAAAVCPVLLEPIEEIAPPFYLPNHDGSFVLSFGKRYELIVDHSSEHADVGGEKYYDRPGVLELRQNARYLLVKTPPGSYTRSVIRYNVETGTFGYGRQSPGTVLFAKWHLRLAGYPIGHPLARPLALFNQS